MVQKSYYETEIEGSPIVGVFDKKREFNFTSKLEVGIWSVIILVLLYLQAFELLRLLIVIRAGLFFMGLIMKDKIIAISPEYIRIDYAASPNYVIRIDEIKNLKLIELPKLKQGVSPSNRDTNLSLSERSEIWFTEGKTAVRMEMAKGQVINVSMDEPDEFMSLVESIRQGDIQFP